MALSDSTLIGLLTSESVNVRSAALDMLSSSFSNDARWLPQIFVSWDRFGPQDAFPEFPLLSHFAIPPEYVGECITRARSMAQGRPLTDRVCRCAGKLIEAISIGSPISFASHLESIRELKQVSKIFFRVSDQKMQARCDWIERECGNLQEYLNETPSSVGNLYEILESQFLLGRADEVLRNGFAALLSEVRDRSAEHTSLICLELASRYRLTGYESWFVELIDHSDQMIADAASIGLGRCRTDTALSLIADRFSEYSKSGQLRSVDVLRRGRIPKTAELLRFLHPHGHGSQVQNALRVAEVLQFDFTSLEDWLEAFLVIDDESFSRIKSQLYVVEPLAQSLSEDDRQRTLKLFHSRFKE
jgi:hypothetical protein